MSDTTSVQNYSGPLSKDIALDHPSENAQEASPVSPLFHIDTLFIAGIPTSTTERELHLLFCTQEGYRFSVLKSYGFPKPCIGFAVFDNHEHAAAAKQRVSGAWFNPCFNQQVRIEWARTTIEMPVFPAEFTAEDIQKRNGVLPVFYSHLQNGQGPHNEEQHHRQPFSNQSKKLEIPWPYSFPPSEYYEYRKEFTAAGCFANPKK